MNTNDEKIQWHPAFDAALQIEFGEEAEYLEFDSEHLLSKKPMQIDVLIKNEKHVKIQKNIGRIFRQYNNGIAGESSGTRRNPGGGLSTAAWAFGGGETAYLEYGGQRKARSDGILYHVGASDQDADCGAKAFNRGGSGYSR